MELIDQIKKYVESLPAEFKENRGVYEFKQVVAERKVLLSKQRLEYSAKFRIDDSQKVLRFTEMLRESGSGLSTGGVGGGSPGFGFKVTVTKGWAGKDETIIQQSNLLGKKYDYKFDSKKIRSKFEDMAKSAGYEFKYQLTAKGL